MALKGLSQAELARRVGVRQPTIFKLTSGTGYGSKHLHLIARELGTTPAYLTGETDDPDVDAPAAPEMNYQQRRLVDLFGVLGPKQEEALLTVVETMASAATSPQPDIIALLPNETLLAQMFEGLLLSLRKDLPVAEQARELAELLPTGLSRLQAFLPSGARRGALEEAAPAHATADLPNRP